MTFNPNIPQGGDPFSQSQGQILTNFGTSNSIFGVNHGEFNNSTVLDRGKHKKVDFLRIAPPGTLANEAVVYQRLVGTDSNLFFRRDNTAADIQLTGKDPVVNSTGSTFLPGGILLNWGSVVASAAGVNAVFATAFTAALYSVTLGVQGNSTSVTSSWTTVDLTKINIYNTSNQVVFYMAIGV